MRTCLVVDDSRVIRKVARRIIEDMGFEVTEAGDGEDGRVKSAIGIGTLLEDGIGDTIRVSLTEDPEFEIPVCKDLVSRYRGRAAMNGKEIPPVGTIPYSPFEYRRRMTDASANIGNHHVPIVVADFMKPASIRREDLKAIGYAYDPVTDKWNIGDAAADYLYARNKSVDFDLPGTLRVILDHSAWQQAADREKYLPLFTEGEYLLHGLPAGSLHFVSVDAATREREALMAKLAADRHAVVCLWSSHPAAMLSVRSWFISMMQRGIGNPVILAVESNDDTIDAQLIHFSAEAGALLLDGLGDGVWLMNDPEKLVHHRVGGRTYLEVRNNHQFLNNTAFSILQATRTRISKTEYISCPSCGRTLFDLQETTARIRAATHHLKGVKIAIMGCIVNGPGEMADADFGYVGSGPGKITLYRGKEIVKRGVDSSVAMEELINLIKESEAWVNESY